MTSSKAYIAILTAMVIWACSGIATKIGLTAFPPITLVTMRFVMAVVLMLIVGWASHSLVRLKRKDLPLFLLAGFTQPFLYFMFESYSLKLLASPTIAEALLSTGPLFAPLFAWLLLRERVTWQNIAGIVISTAGMLLLIVDLGGTAFEIGDPTGVLLAMLAVFSAVLYTILLRKMPARYNSLSIVLYVQLSALIFFVPAWALTDGRHLADLSFSWQAFEAVGFLAVFSSVVAFVLFCYAVRRLGVTRANAFNNIRPVFTALIMLSFFGEQLPWVKWIGIAVVIVGLFICQSSGKTPAKRKKQ